MEHVSNILFLSYFYFPRLFLHLKKKVPEMKHFSTVSDLTCTFSVSFSENDELHEPRGRIFQDVQG